MNVWQSAADAAARILLAIPAGYEGDVFRPGQREVIDAVCHEGKNVLAVLPTGSGKTLTFVVPVHAAHTILHGRQIGIVVVPLQAIMKQMVDGINTAMPVADGCCPTAVHTPISTEHTATAEAPDRETLEVKDGVPLYKKDGVAWAMLNERSLRFVVTTPETLCGSGANSLALRSAAIELIAHRNLMLLGIDECHLLLRSFRPLYARVAEVLLTIIDAGMARQSTTEDSHRPRILAVTGTLTRAGQMRLARALRIDVIVREPCQRRNLHIMFINAFDATKEAGVGGGILASLVAKAALSFKFISAPPSGTVTGGHAAGSGICFAPTRISCMVVVSALGRLGYTAVQYHAGMQEAEKQHNLALWSSGEVQFLVGTTALGMGVNHPHVRYVVHLRLPTDIMDFLQEIGRGGRDGYPCLCCLVWHPQLFRDVEHVLRLGHGSSNLAALREMVEMVSSRGLCRRTQIRLLMDEEPPACASVPLHSISAMLDCCDICFLPDSGCKVDLSYPGELILEYLTCAVADGRPILFRQLMTASLELRRDMRLADLLDCVQTQAVVIALFRQGHIWCSDQLEADRWEVFPDSTQCRHIEIHPGTRWLLLSREAPFKAGTFLEPAPCNSGTASKYSNGSTTI